MGRRVSWKWGNQTHYGTVIRETAKKIFALTKNGKIKTIFKKD
tara:strand:- start:747 stop:875 length:129 start_codon:yes stop_codon:yes gene_type:complete